MPDAVHASLGVRTERVGAGTRPSPRWLLAALGVVALAGTTLITAWVGLFIIGIAAAAAAAVISVCQDRVAVWTAVLAAKEAAASADRVSAAAVREHELQRLLDGAEWSLRRWTLLGDSFDRIARAVATMAYLSAARRRAEFKTIVSDAMNAILLVVDVPGVRAVLYEVAPGERSMRVIRWQSINHRRSPQPFVRETPRGDKAFLMLRDGEAELVRDIASAPSTWAGSGDGYETFITCPVTDSEALLTVDALAAGDLTDDHKAALRLVAGILATAFAERTRR